MARMNWMVLAALLASVAAPAQQPAYTNADVLNMIRANLPENTVVEEIKRLADTGQASFDISPAALVQLRQQGASEQVLNVLIWAETEVVPVLQRPVLRAVMYRNGDGLARLNGFLLWPHADPSYTVWPAFLQRERDVTVSTPVGPLRIAANTPSLLVQGFNPDADWQLVRMRDEEGRARLRMKKKDAWRDDFMRDDVFRRDDLTPVRIADAGDGMFSITPAAALEAGRYVLCGEPMDGAIMRVCYPFEIGAGGI